MRTFISTSIAAIMIATSVAPAHADIFGDAKRWASGAAKTVGNAAQTAGKAVSNTAQKAGQAASAAASDVKDFAVDAGGKIVDGGETALYHIGETTIMAGQKIKTGAELTWDGTKWVAGKVVDAGDTLINGDAADRRELARNAYNSYKSIEPILGTFFWQVGNTKDGLVVVEHLKAKRWEEAARALLGLSAYDEVMQAANAAGMKTITIGVGGDCSSVVGYVSELGIAIDVAKGLQNRPESGLRGYSTIGYTVGLSIGCDVSLGFGMWKADNNNIGGDGWGAVVAAVPGGGASVGAWFDYSDANRGLGALQGITFAPSYGVSVEIGEINRVKTVQF
ncbi:MAG: hypothetical protein R3C46_13920 [Hyphomonadaceae bacterium]